MWVNFTDVFRWSPLVARACAAAAIAAGKAEKIIQPRKETQE